MARHWTTRQLSGALMIAIYGSDLNQAPQRASAQVGPRAKLWSKPIGQNLATLLARVNQAFKGNRHDRVDALLDDAAARFRYLSDVLEQPTRIAILGEPNAGKTTLANRLIGQRILPTSVVATAPYDVRVRHGEKQTVTVLMRDGTARSIKTDALPTLPPDDVKTVEITLPNERLRGIEILDFAAQQSRANTPGWTKQPGTTHQAADLWIWCTNAARAWGESERVARTSATAMSRPRAILAATHADTLMSAAAEALVRARLERETAHLFDTVLFTSPADPPLDAGFETHIADRIDRLRARRTKTTARLSRRLAQLTLQAVPAVHSQDSDAKQPPATFNAVLRQALLAVTKAPLTPAV